MADEFIWMSKMIVKLIHDDQINEHGGSYGIRDKGLLDSALARPKNICAYEKKYSIGYLAASYGYGIARNHPFIDGNKRTAFQVMFVFPKINGKTLNAPETEVVIIMENLASGTITESQLADWIEEHLQSNDER